MEEKKWWENYQSVLGLLMLAAGLTLVLVGQEEIGIPLLAAATGVALGKSGSTKVAPVLLAGILAFGAMSCSAPRTVSVDAIEPGLELIMQRHDEYVKADQSLDEFLKDVYLRSTKLIRLLLEEAKK